MLWLWTIFIGFLAGVLAKFLMPGRDPGGIIVTTLLGILGAMVATFLGQRMVSARQFDWTHWVDLWGDSNSGPLSAPLQERSVAGGFAKSLGLRDPNEIQPGQKLVIP
jgi:uncharacterized membrane protein YeaQ/YmgE (transglycosylase-associated protein family)